MMGEIMWFSHDESPGFAKSQQLPKGVVPADAQCSSLQPEDP
jgi:hypothetical protein